MFVVSVCAVLSLSISRLHVRLTPKCENCSSSGGATGQLHSGATGLEPIILETAERTTNSMVILRQISYNMADNLRRGMN
jgi:hypothetical protein